MATLSVKKELLEEFDKHEGVDYTQKILNWAKSKVSKEKEKPRAVLMQELFDIWQKLTMYPLEQKLKNLEREYYNRKAKLLDDINASESECRYVNRKVKKHFDKFYAKIEQQKSCGAIGDMIDLDLEHLHSLDFVDKIDSWVKESRNKDDNY